MGIYYTALNDYVDCFASQKWLKKPGLDIEIGKFSWLATMAMEHGTEKQKDILRKFYGKYGKFWNQRDKI